jgi:hypothetical protein
MNNLTVSGTLSGATFSASSFSTSGTISAVYVDANVVGADIITDGYATMTQGTLSAGLVSSTVFTDNVGTVIENGSTFTNNLSVYNQIKLLNTAMSTAGFDPVVNNAIVGKITIAAATIAAGTTATLVVTNENVSTLSIIIGSLCETPDDNSNVSFAIRNIADQLFTVVFGNNSTVDLSGTVAFNYIVINPPTAPPT